MTQARDLADGKFDTNTLVVDAANNRIGIGTASPSRQLEIFDDGTAGQAVLALTAQNNENSRIMFADPDDNNIGILDYDHTNDAMKFIVNNAERGRWLSGGGLTFNGDTAAANALDDYEEGTFTPVFLQGITTPGYATQTGTYIKIGRQVICSIFLRANSGTENNGHIYVGGLPFTITNDIDHNFGAFFTYNGGFFTSGDATSWLALRNQTNLAFYKQSNGGAIVGTDSNVAANLNADLRIVAIYRAD